MWSLDIDNKKKYTRTVQKITHFALAHDAKFSNAWNEWIVKNCFMILSIWSNIFGEVSISILFFYPFNSAFYYNSLNVF